MRHTSRTTSCIQHIYNESNEWSLGIQNVNVERMTDEVHCGGDGGRPL